MMKKNINNTEAIKHPEQRDGEVFLINVIDGETWGVPNFCSSTRVGNIAYKTGFKELSEGYKPLFGILK